MFEKTMGNVFQNDGQRFPKLWAMFRKRMGNVLQAYQPCFFQAMQDLYLISKGVVETCLEPETGLRNVA